MSDGDERGMALPARTSRSDMLLISVVPASREDVPGPVTAKSKPDITDATEPVSEVITAN